MIKKSILYLFLQFMIVWLSNGQPAVDSLKSALYSTMVPVREKVLLYSEIACYYLSIDPDSAEYYASSGVEYSITHGFIAGIFKNSCELGKVYLGRDDLDEAARIFTTSLKYIDRLDDKQNALCIYLLLGYVYDMQEKYLESHRCLYQGLNIAEEIGDSTFLWSFYNNLGNHQLAVENYEDALKLYRNALAVYFTLDETKRHFSLASVYNNLGTVFMNINQLDSAQYYLKKALAVSDVRGNYYGIVNLNLNLGEVALMMGNHDGALKYLADARVALDSLQKGFEGTLAPLNATYYNLLSKVYFEMKHLQKAMDYCLTALEYADQLSELTIRTESYKRLAAISEAMNDISNAYRYQTLYIESMDSLDKRKSNKEINRISLEYEYDKELKKNQVEKELNELKNHRKEIMYIFIVVTTAGIIITLLLLFRLQLLKVRKKSLEEKTARLEKEKIKDQLEYKDKELTTNVLYLLKKNEFHASIAKKLQEMVVTLDEKNSRNLNKIIAELSNSASKDVWEEFEVRFKEVHVDFYNRLSQQIPGLTTQDFRLCAFLRLNMTNKEIAAITYQSLDSLRTARYRLRKKLGIDRDENLVAFLAKI